MNKKLMRCIHGRKLCGVCGGIAQYFSIDPTLVRLAWAFGTLLSVGLGLVGYLVAAFIIPEETITPDGF